MRLSRLIPLAAAAAGLAACSGASKPTADKPGPEGPKLDVRGEWTDPEGDYPRPRLAPEGARANAAVNPRATPIAITGATLLTANGKTIADGTILMWGGAITHVGDASVAIPKDARVIDGRGKFVTPGIIDTHSHIGVYASPNVRAHSDGNEATAPNTAQARAEFGYWPQDPAITRAAAGGITTAQILPGSANLFGGRGFTIVMRPGRTADEVAFPGAPATIKMACGENPKRVYGDKGGPSTRMGEYAYFRDTFQAAAEYDARLRAYRRARTLWHKKKARAAELDAAATDEASKIAPEPAPEPPPRDSKLETLAGVLRGEVLPQIHCYRADEMQRMIEIADDFGFKIRSFHHALEAYKIRDLIAAHGAAISTWADWWGFKMEAFDGIMENAALFDNAGGTAVIHSDSATLIQRLNQEAAKALWAGRHAGLTIDDDRALRWITRNPAWALGIDDVTGTLEKGKRADVVLWSAHPFSVYALAEVTIAGGEITFERQNGLAPTDFELGNSAIDGASR